MPRYIFILCFISLFLLACGPSSTSSSLLPQTTSTATLENALYEAASSIFRSDVGESLLLDWRAGNCLITGAHSIGQAHAYLQEGGESGTPSSTIGTATEAKEAIEHLSPKRKASDTSLLIVDDFASGANAHGFKVFSHAVNIFAPGTGLLPTQNSISLGNNVFLQPVGLDFDLSTLNAANIIAPAIAQALTKTSNVVVNMSFSIIPCSIKDDFEQGNYVSSSDYQNALLNSKEGSEFEKAVSETAKGNMPPNDLIASLQRLSLNQSKLAPLEDYLTNHGAAAFQAALKDLSHGRSNPTESIVNQIIFTPLDPDNDPVIQLISNYNTEYGLIRIINNIITPLPTPANKDKVVFVAAAGNHGLDYSLSPASLPEVLAVSADTFDTTPRKASWSNSGQVLALGGLFKLDNILYQGSSYAAPLVGAYGAYTLPYAPDCWQAMLLSGATSDTPLEHFLCP